MSKNHEQSIPAEILSELQRVAEQLRRDIEPYVTPLTPSERQTVPKMGEKTFSFVEKSFELAKLNPDLCPPYLDMNAFTEDFRDARGLLPLLVTLSQVVENIEDTQLLAGSEAYLAALTFYNSVKQAASQDVSGAKAVYEELKKRFPRTKRRNDNPNTTNEDKTI
jgi:hypothetical protein